MRTNPDQTVPTIAPTPEAQTRTHCGYCATAKALICGD
jgi:hypothetical protein